MTKRRTAVLFAGSLLLVLLMAAGSSLMTASTDVEGEETPGNPKSGRDLFIKQGCARCHSVWSGGAKIGPDLASIGMGRNLYDLAASVWSHWSQMNTRLQQEKIQRIELDESNFKDIVAYLYYLNYYREPGDAKLGAELFEGKGCARCHGTEPLTATQKPGRPVYEMYDFEGPIALAVAAWNHGRDMHRTMEGKGVGWPQFQESEVTDLAAFVRARTGKTQGSEWVVPGDFLKGRDLFRQKSCSACHKVSGLAPPPGSKLPASGKTNSLSCLTAELWNHYPRMSGTMASSGIPYAAISREEMEDIVAFLYWSKAFSFQGNAASGRRLYESKHCASCHSPASGKPAAAPALTGSGAAGSVYGLLAAIWNHGPQMESMLRERNLAWPPLTGEEMSDLIAFFRGKP